CARGLRSLMDYW
nr:immunoglobulin heavy chain junction region [Mus musculus]